MSGTAPIDTPAKADETYCWPQLSKVKGMATLKMPMVNAKAHAFLFGILFKPCPTSQPITERANPPISTLTNAVVQGPNVWRDTLMHIKDAPQTIPSRKIRNQFKIPGFSGEPTIFLIIRHSIENRGVLIRTPSIAKFSFFLDQLIFQLKSRASYLAKSHLLPQFGERHFFYAYPEKTVFQQHSPA